MPRSVILRGCGRFNLQWLWRGVRAVAACVCPSWVLQPQFFITGMRVERTRAEAPRYDLLTLRGIRAVAACFSRSFSLPVYVLGGHGKHRAAVCLREDHGPPGEG